MVIKIPPLRERLDDMPILVDYFIMKQNYILGKQIRSINPEVLSKFLVYDWPGNVRELEHLIIEAAMNMAGDDDSIIIDLLPEHFLDAVRKKPSATTRCWRLRLPRPRFRGARGRASLDDTERRSICETLKAA